VDIEKELELAAYLKSLQNTNAIKPGIAKKNRATNPNSEGWNFSHEEARVKQKALGSTNRIVELGNGIQLEFVKVPAGEYVANDNSIVIIEKPYWIGQFEITNAQYNHFFPDHDSRYIAQFWKDHTSRGYPINQPGQPVVRISWEESRQFCNKLSKKTGLTFSLPSEEQWEWACRAGAGTPFWFGQLDADFSEYENLADASLSDFAVIGVDPKPMKKTDPRFPYYDFIPKAAFNDGEMISSTPGNYKPNLWGIHDMHGNVSEWVLDDYNPEQLKDSFVRQDDRKTVKGGSWRDRPYRSTASSTLGYYPWQKVVNVGFRVVMEE
jgi:formylglycine-generating enzyme required for sulfatase activity